MKKTTAYNDLGNVTEEAYYDGEDNLVDTTWGYAKVVYTYDELGRKISQTDITGRQVSYRFDKSNQMVAICNEVDQSIV